jgi:4-hydroxy 2-oxovalerate aldolase
MSKFEVLDCTLRDGGYCNNWNFGYENIKKIITALIETNVEIVECGFLTNDILYTNDKSKYTNLEQLNLIIPPIMGKPLFVCMINYGEFDVKHLPECNDSIISGIRLAFHKDDLEEAIGMCLEIKKKGYLLFIQPMVSLSYTENEFKELILKCNEIEPYAFYIVDSFGGMQKKELTRLFNLVDQSLKESIRVGFHSHNNMQLAYANAQALVDIQTKRNIIIDTCILGMGRGAGNLNTELFVDYLNNNVISKYEVKPLLQVIDEVINYFYSMNYWGYSLPNYLSAKYNTHPSYATYLTEKNTLTIDNINEIFEVMDDSKRLKYEQLYIEKLYESYMDIERTNDERISELKQFLDSKKVLLIAPGYSAEDESDKIVSYVLKEDIVSISINYQYTFCATDFIFLSNLRRYKELNKSNLSKTIVTSNIPGDGVYIKIRYSEFLNDIDSVRDNAGMMVIKFLLSIGVSEILLAGFDGYSYNNKQNYVEEQMTLVAKDEIIDNMNKGMREMLNEFSKKVNISYLTKPKFIDIDLV